MSLTSVAEQTRAMIIVGTITLVAIVLGYMAYNYFVNNILPNLNPPAPPQATYGYGLLPPIEFPENNASNYTYRLETVGDFIPSLGGYFMPVYPLTKDKKSSGFFSLDRAKEQAAALGFILEPQQIQNTEYRWIRNNPIYAQLDLDSVNSSFTLDVSWQTDPSFLSETNTPTPDAAAREIKGLLSGANFLYPDIANGLVETKLLQYEGGEFSEAISQSETQFVQVDLFRSPLVIGEKSYKIVHAVPGKGLASGLVSSSRTQGKRILHLEYNYITILYDAPETYPYITGPEAWALLQQGYGYVAQPPTVGTEAVVRDVSVAYYDPLDESQKFLQPIYIFEGDNDFVAYVPALRSDSFQATQ